MPHSAWPGTSRLRPRALLAGVALLATAAAPLPSVPYPTYAVGPQPDGSIVMSPNQTITPAGRLVGLGAPVRAKAIAINPDPASHTAAVLSIGSNAVQIIDLVSGKVLQSYSPGALTDGSYGGIAYTPDGAKLLFSHGQTSALSIATVDPATGLLGTAQNVALPPDNTIALYTPYTAYPGGVAPSPNGAHAYVVLNQNNTLGVVDLLQTPPRLVAQIPVGNAPNAVLAAGNIAYVSNEGGRPALRGDFTDMSAGTKIVSNPKTDSASTGTVSVVDIAGRRVVKTIAVGLHPTGMALSGNRLYVANAYGDSVSVIDTGRNIVLRTISVGVPLAANAFGGNPSGVAVAGSRLYVALYTSNAIAVVDLEARTKNPVLGYIPTASTPSTIAYDAAHNQLVVSDDKGIGTQGANATLYGVTAFNSHQDTGTISLIPVPDTAKLAKYTAQVMRNNHWDLAQNTQIGPRYANPNARPVAIPAHIGEPSLIRHVFLIIKENRTYDQLFGDIATANGDPSLAIFAPYTPNQHALLHRFALLDNVYAPSRQSADGHPWIVSGIAAYAADIQSPYWIRGYPGGTANDEMVYTPRGFLWDAATAKGLSVRLYGEWSGAQTIAGAFSWSDWYRYCQILEGKLQATSPITPDTDSETTTVPSARKILDPHYPSFNTAIPDQYRTDYWLPIFARQESTNTLPALSIIWLPDDHTSGYSTGLPIPAAAQADNDLALGRIVEAISHSKDWLSTAIFVEEDDGQNGVDHVDGHRQPVQVISPYAVRSNGTPDHTMYTAASINRTIEQILGLAPMTQFDLVASPMRTAFTNTSNPAPFTHLEPTIPLDTLAGQRGPGKHAANALQRAWNLASNALFAHRLDKADSIDPYVLNHLTWYAATNFRRPYPGERRVRMPGEFNLNAPSRGDD